MIMLLKYIRRSLYIILPVLISFGVINYSRIGKDQEEPYSQVRIPLDTLNGVPFNRDQMGEYYTEGFDVDDKGNYYFFGGKTPSLVCFSKNAERIYRRSLANLIPGQIRILANRIYLFEIGDNSLNALVELDKNSGQVIRKYPNSISNVLKSNRFVQIDSYQFKDSVLSITYLDSEGIEKKKTTCFNLTA